MARHDPFAIFRGLRTAAIPKADVTPLTLQSVKFSPQARCIQMLTASTCVASCAGTVGTIRSRTWQGIGTNITEIRSYGIQIRNIPSYCGISLGHHQTLYANRAPEAQLSDPNDSTWYYGYCNAPSEAPIFLQETIYGGEVASSQIFVGLACGITTRATAVLDLHQNEAIAVAPFHGHQPSISYFTFHPPSSP